MIYKVIDAEKRLKNIKLLLLDVDGVMTDGSIIYNDSGEEIKVFCVRDGFGIRMLMDSGINVGIVTGRSSESLYHRCKNLHIQLIFDGISDKAAALYKITEKTGIKDHEIAYMGDDLPDISIMRIIGIPIAVADAHESVIEVAHIVTSAKGGAGAIREVCEAIIKAQDNWEASLKRL
ncbi:MAG: HAD-IIIA family hydrolase [Desulfobacteraceae bacterium]|nr:MAG: HAD-IIIA family hydrolase [Desulfobacteraceae bacterium]